MCWPCRTSRRPSTRRQPCSRSWALPGVVCSTSSSSVSPGAVVTMSSLLSVSSCASPKPWKPRQVSSKPGGALVTTPASCPLPVMLIGGASLGASACTYRAARCWPRHRGNGGQIPSSSATIPAGVEEEAGGKTGKQDDYTAAANKLHTTTPPAASGFEQTWVARAGDPARCRLGSWQEQAKPAVTKHDGLWRSSRRRLPRPCTSAPGRPPGRQAGKPPASAPSITPDRGSHRGIDPGLIDRCGVTSWRTVIWADQPQ